jgi:hypothetical protein
VGKLPTKLFWLTSMVFNEVRVPSDFGNEESNPLQEMLRKERLRNSWIWYDTMPLRFMLERSSLSTNPLVLHRTPVQLQWGDRFPAALPGIFQPISLFDGSIRLDLINNKVDNSSYCTLWTPSTKTREKAMQMSKNSKRVCIFSFFGVCFLLVVWHFWLWGTERSSVARGCYMREEEVNQPACHN